MQRGAPPITTVVKYTIYRFAMADNSILFLRSLFPVLFFGDVDLHAAAPRRTGSEMYRARCWFACIRVYEYTRCHAKCNVHAIQKRTAAVTLFASTRTSMPSHKGINRITSTRERIGFWNRMRAYVRRCIHRDTKYAVARKWILVLVWNLPFPIAYQTVYELLRTIVYCMETVGSCI